MAGMSCCRTISKRLLVARSTLIGGAVEVAVCVTVVDFMLEPSVGVRVAEESTLSGVELSEAELLTGVELRLESESSAAAAKAGVATGLTTKSLVTETGIEDNAMFWIGSCCKFVRGKENVEKSAMGVGGTE